MLLSQGCRKMLERNGTTGLGRSGWFRSFCGSSMPGDAGGSVTNAVDHPVSSVGHQQRAILEDLHVGRPADVIVVLDEPREERLDRLHGPVLVELWHHDVAADLLAPVPGAVARDEDRVAIFGREHVVGIEPHAERGCMRAHLANKLTASPGRLSTNVTKPLPAEVYA